MREAVRTSILSGRWRCLWTYIPKLYFNDSNMFAAKAVDTFKLSMQEQEIFVEERTDKFIRRVNEFLRHHRGVGVHTFRVSFFLHKKHADHLDRWTRFAIASGAKDLIVDLILRFDVDNAFFETAEPYELDCQLFAGGRGSSLERIYLARCSLRVPPNFDGFNSLKALYLLAVNVDDSDIQALLSSSPSLETLYVRESDRLVNLKISHPSGQLKHLTVEVCNQLREIEFSHVNLTNFDYRGHRVTLRCRTASQLTRAYINIGEPSGAVDYYCTGLPHNVPQLKTLFFSFNQYDEVVNLPEKLNKFTHLKHLVVFVLGICPEDLLWLSSILSAAPFLEKFELHFGFFKQPEQERKVMRRPSKCSHDHVKTIEISGFTGSISEIEIAIYMLNHAVALDYMTIMACNKFYSGNGKLHRGLDAKTAAQERLQSVASNYLKGEVPSGAKLVIL